MKNFCLVISLIFIIASSSAFAQTQDDAKWQIISPPVEEFSAAFPVLPESANFDERDTSENNSRRYTAESGGTYFFIFSDAANKPAQSKTVLDFVGHFQTDASLPAGDFQSKKFAFDDPDDYHYTILAVKTPTRIYIFQTTGSQDNPQIERFFASIKFNKQITNVGNGGAPETKNKKDELRAVMTMNMMRGRTGEGSGDGSGAGNGITPKISPAAADALNSPLKILSKPRASYTDLARFYRINGKVRLRITFLADGTIGSVTPISKLPFGLTEQVISAARGIKFTPPKKDGKPYEVAKFIEYGFQIY